MPIRSILYMGVNDGLGPNDHSRGGVTNLAFDIVPVKLVTSSARGLFSGYHRPPELRGLGLLRNAKSPHVEVSRNPCDWLIIGLTRASVLCRSQPSLLRRTALANSMVRERRFPTRNISGHLTGHR
jgi:hypothetical protein